MNDILACELCGRKLPSEDFYRFHDRLLCGDCLSEHTVTCSHCGERIWREDNAGDASTPLCSSCCHQFYNRCQCCGSVIDEDHSYYDEEEEETLCWSCYESRRIRDSIIEDYSYRPEPIFHGKGPRFFGVELEIDEGGENDRNAELILEQANRNGLETMYAKHDGSINNGFELVTHPLSYHYHMDAMPWDDILQEARQLGYCSHRAGTCGLHIHVSRKAFGKTDAEQEPCIARILYFVERFWAELLKFSRRTQNQLERWAARYGYKDRPMDILDHAKKGYHGGRYTCVNLYNPDTIEFRIFRGTLKLNTLLATIQLVDRICDIAINLTDEELKAMSWTSFAAGCAKPELVMYLKERRLYINEPVDTDAEV